MLKLRRKLCEGFENDFYQLVNWQRHMHKGYERYGTVALSCYLCKKNFCGSCEYNCEGADFCCMSCEKYYCQECNAVVFCEGMNCTTFHQAFTCAVCDEFKKWWVFNMCHINSLEDYFDYLILFCSSSCMESSCPECDNDCLLPILFSALLWLWELRWETEYVWRWRM